MPMMTARCTAKVCDQRLPGARNLCQESLRVWQEQARLSLRTSAREPPGVWAHPRGDGASMAAASSWDSRLRAAKSICMAGSPGGVAASWRTGQVRLRCGQAQ